MNTPEVNTPATPRRWRGLKRVALVTALALGGGATLSVWAMDRHGPGMMGGGHGMAMFGGGRGLDRMLDGVDATEAQRAQIKQIAKAAADDLRGQREQRRALMDRAMAVYTAPTVDATAAEQLRQQMLAQHDATSKRMTAAMVEASRVLSPEQRAKLAERIKQRRDRMQERHGRMMERGTPPASK
jgi:protein CpxP